MDDFMEVMNGAVKFERVIIGKVHLWQLLGRNCFIINQKQKDVLDKAGSIKHWHKSKFFTKKNKQLLYICSEEFNDGWDRAFKESFYKEYDARL
jgi:hypothetical protein